MNIKDKTIFTGDNLYIMRGMDSESVDLIYLDPPFNSNKKYSAPIGSKAAGAFFKDTWTLSDVDLVEAGRLREEQGNGLYKFVEAAQYTHSKGMRSYLTMMAPRLVEMRRILKPTGSIYLHCDPTASHYLKGLMDAIFGRNNFRNEIVWRKYGGRKNNAKRKLTTQRDSIFLYAKSKDALFVPLFIPHSLEEIKKKYTHVDKSGRRYRLSWGGSYQATGRQKRIYLDESPGRAVGDLWIEDGLQLNTSSAERTGYPTQKPLALLERIIKLSSEEKDIVFDPFCGCATALVAANDLRRQWVGIDISPEAAKQVVGRIKERQGKLFEKIIHRKDIPSRTDIGEELSASEKRAYKKILYGLQGGNCNGCNMHHIPEILEMDHITPKSIGGTDHKENFQLLCPPCNKRKGRRRQEEFMAEMLAAELR